MRSLRKLKSAKRPRGRSQLKQKRLQRGGISEDEKFAILAEIRTLEDKYVWQTTAAVALFEIQHCLSCGHTHRFFQGWMTAQQHKRDSHCRRLTRGKPTELLPECIEEHDHGTVEMCGDCAEACLAINAYLRTEQSNGRPNERPLGNAGAGGPRRPRTGSIT